MEVPIITVDLTTFDVDELRAEGRISASGTFADGDPVDVTIIVEDDVDS